MHTKPSIVTISVRHTLIRSAAALVSVLVTCCVLPASGQALSSIPGAFVDIGIGARSAALGYTGVAAERGANALAWNPASLLPADEMEVSFSWVDQVELVEFGHMAWAMPLRPGRSAWGLAAEVSGDEMLREATLRAAYSHRIRFMWVGLGIGYRRADYGKNRLSDDDYVVFDPDEITQGIARQVSGSANGLLLDAGIRIEMTHRLDIAVAAKNMVAPVEWSSQSAARTGTNVYFESVPMELSTGVAYRLSDRMAGFLEWTPALGTDAVPRFGLGAAFTPIDILTFRLGRMMTQDRVNDEWKTFGFGLRTPPSRDWSIEADYAYVVSAFARTQQISIRFGL